jgi:hypothetical protein
LAGAGPVGRDPTIVVPTLADGAGTNKTKKWTCRPGGAFL